MPLSPFSRTLCLIRHCNVCTELLLSLISFRGLLLLLRFSLGSSFLSHRGFFGSNFSRSLFRTTTAASGFLLCTCSRTGSIQHVFVEIYQFDVAHLSSITQTITQFKNTAIANGTSGQLLGNLTKVLSSRFFVLKIIKS